MPNLPGNCSWRRGFKERVSDPILWSILARGQHHRPLKVLSGLFKGRSRDRRGTRAPLLQHPSVMTHHGDRRGAGGSGGVPVRGRRTFPSFRALSRGQTGEGRRRGGGSHCCRCRGGGRGVDAVRHKTAGGAMHPTTKRGAMHRKERGEVQCTKCRRRCKALSKEKGAMHRIKRGAMHQMRERGVQCTEQAGCNAPGEKGCNTPNEGREER